MLGLVEFIYSQQPLPIYICMKFNSRVTCAETAKCPSESGIFREEQHVLRYSASVMIKDIDIIKHI